MINNDTKEKEERNNLFHDETMEAMRIGSKMATPAEPGAPRAISYAAVIVMDNGDIMTHYAGAVYPFQFIGALEYLKNRINQDHIQYGVEDE